MNMQFSPEQVQALLDGQVKLLDVLTRRRQAYAEIQCALPRTQEEARSSPLFDFIPFQSLYNLIQTQIDAIDQEMADRNKGVEQMRLDLAGLKSRVVAPGQGMAALFPRKSLS